MPTAQLVKEKNGKLNFIKIKIFVQCIYNKGLLSKIYKNY